MEKWDTGPEAWDRAWDMSGTFSFKTLARKALERDSAWGSCPESAPIACPTRPSPATLFGTVLSHGWDATDWQAEYDERAAIMEFDGGVSREEAERLAQLTMPDRIHSP